MKVVGHQHIGVNCTGVTLYAIVQEFREMPVVFRRREDRFAIVAALNRMQRLTGNKEAGKAGHELSA